MILVFVSIVIGILIALTAPNFSQPSANLPHKNRTFFHKRVLLGVKKFQLHSPDVV